MDQPIIEIDVHGSTVDEAINRIDRILNGAGSGTYRIRVIHGFNRGRERSRGFTVRPT